MKMAAPFKIEIDRLKHEYIKAKESLLPESEAIEIDFTETFYEWLREMIDRRKLIVVAIRGRVRSGKSTAAIAVMKYVNEYIVSIRLNPDATKAMWKYIFSDQTEFLRFINEPIRNVCIDIDEFNRMARTGYNATTEEALYEHYSDVFAGKYIHRVTASPSTITDRNTEVILDVIEENQEARVVHCKLIYRDIITNNYMTLGRVDVYVGDLITHWIDDGVRDLVETKPHLTPEEERTVQYWKEHDFYCRYQVKKYARMALMDTHGVKDIRDLEFSLPVLITLQHLQEPAKTKRISMSTIRLEVDNVCRAQKRIYNILTTHEIADRVKGLIDVFHEICKDEARIDKCKTAVQKDGLQRSIEHQRSLLDEQLRLQRHYERVYKEYMGIT